MVDGFEEFCNGTLWNETLLLNNYYPQFTDCFQNTLLVWVPCGFLWATLPFYLPALLSSKDDDVPPVPLNWLNVSKSFLSLMLAFLSAVELIKAASDHESLQKTTATAVYVALAIKFGSYMLSAVLLQLERGKGFITSGVLFVFFLLMTLAGIVPFYTYIEEKVYNYDLDKFVLFYISWSFLFIQLVLHCIAEKVTRRGYYELGRKPCPETKSSILSRLTYWWMNSLIINAYKKDLTEDDLFDLNPRDASDRVIPQFSEQWEKELSKHRKTGKSSAPSGRQNVTFQVGKAQHHLQASERTPLVGTSSRTYSTTVEIKDPKKKQQEGASLFKVLAKTYGPDFLKAWGCKFLYDLLQMASPSLLSVLIGYVENKNANKNEYEWKGYVYALGFFIIALLQSTFFHQNFHIGMTLGMRIRSALIAAVYKKSLTMNNEARKTSTVGEIVNLMSVDCQRMQDLSGYLWMIWSAPVQITLAMYLLWIQLGPSVLAGLALMLLLIPVNAVISMKQRKLQVDLMKFKDKRLKLMSEVLNGMKVLKLYAWEPSFQDKISEIRTKETNILKKNAIYSAFSSFSFTTAPFLVTLVTFLTYVFTSDTGYLSAQKAFTSLALFNILRFPINLLPMMISYVIQANVSIGRISKFLKNGDLDPNAVQHEPKSDSVVSVENGTFSWDSELQPALQGVNIKIPAGKLVAVVGQVGSGKSSLLSALLGEMDKLSGSVNVNGNVAYVPQQAWIQNATVKDNILFGKHMEEGKYNEILEACALKPDLEILTGGDMTEIGEKGINLSGGQKQRVSLARAVYNNADIYMLDDPLSAVDSHVGKHIFQKVVGAKGLLRNKTRIMVTHGIHWLPLVDSIIVLIDGKITEMGTYDELLGHDGAFAQFLKTYLTQENPDEEEDEEIEQMKSKILERVESVTSDTGATSGEEGKARKRKDKSAKAPLARSISTIDGSELPGKDKKDVKALGDQPKMKEKDKLIQEEKAEKGQVKWKVFMMYFRAIGMAASAIILAIFIVFQVSSVGANIWLSIWTNDKELANISLANTTEYQNRNYMFLGIYAAFGVVQGAVIMIYTLLATYKMVDASRKLHNAMLENVMKAPMSFFDTTPSGRIVNRFSRDVETTDNTLPMVLRMWLNMFFSTLSTFIVISYSTPLFMTIIVPVLIFYFAVQRFYVPTSRQLQRIESTTRSPIFNHFSESLNGASSIRAYHEQERFINESLSRVDKNILYYFARIASNRWLGWRLEFAGNLIVFAAAIFAVVTPNLSGGLVGLSVSYALQVTSALNMLVRQTAELETNVVAVERLKEYSEVETEAEWIRPFRRPPHDWPANGGVIFHDYKTRYREGLDLVLRGISFQVLGGQKVGIVGRTGAGKSSLTVALFRLIESTGGQIVIDGQRISDIGLHDLRGKLTILPQDPVLFSGTLRMNIDPFNAYTDENIWHALQHSHLKAFVEGLPEGLQHECGEGGQNLSVGQRQLVCLARTLLRKSKILILDEATAAVDMETDDLIQKTIRTEFKDSTVLTIAHRLNTIMDYDKVLVLDQGLVKEYDSPDNLLKNKSSVFYGMAKDANLV